MTYNVLLEDLIRDLGGCGIYQWLLCIIAHMGNTAGVWSMVTMAFAGQDPGFWCKGNIENGTKFDDLQGECKINGTDNSCTKYYFNDDAMTTVVSEWGLVCDRKWTVAMITTIQMAGVSVGCIICGHLSDLIGRKPTFFLSLLLLIVFNVAAYFSVSWEMYAAMLFFIGIGTGFQMAVKYILPIEFVPSRWRPAIVATPAFSLEACLFALFAWLFHDWKSIHLAIAIIGAPFLITWWFVQESFRWLVTKQRFEDADNVVAAIAKVNRSEKPDLTKIIATAKDEESHQSSNKKYSAIDLFRTRESTKTTIALLFIWFSASYGFYGMTFGAKSLAGDLYMNILLINLVPVPATFSIVFLVNWFGRKKVCLSFFSLSGVAGLTVGVLQYIDSPISGQITNILALVAKLGVSSGWNVVMVYTTELYPTVVRNIAYGVHSTVGRFGGMVAPQIVFLPPKERVDVCARIFRAHLAVIGHSALRARPVQNDDVPGLLYFISGVFMIVSACLILILKETKGLVLEDTFITNKNEKHSKDGANAEETFTKL